MGNPNILDKICATTREHVATQKLKVSFDTIKEQARNAVPPRGFIAAIKRHAVTPIIAEVKKASPGAGLIRADFDAVTIARTYEDNGAACLSVLTDAPYFQGSDEYLTAIKQAVRLPILRKDFMVDEYQIYESRALGADCVLLIMACLADDQAAAFYKTAAALGMDVLVEVHNEEELDRALKLNPAMIGVNNRNLKTMVTSLQTSHDLAKQIPRGTVKISESGIKTGVHIKKLQASGYDGFLVGESMMREPDIGAALNKLLL